MEQLLEKNITQMELDVIGEIANISFGSASTVLSDLLHQQVTISTPKVEIVDLYNTKDIDIPHVVLEVNFHKGIEMRNLFVLQSEVAAAIADLMMMGDGNIDPNEELSELHLSAVQEAMNQMMGHSATAMSNMFGEMIDITTPDIKVIALKEQLEDTNDQTMIKVGFDLIIGDLITSNLMQLIPVDKGRELAKRLLGDAVPEPAPVKEEISLTAEELDVFLEVCNIGIGSASTVLSKLLNRKVSLSVPTARVIDSKEFEFNERPCLVTSVEFVEGLRSSNTFIISKNAALIMADLMMMGDGMVQDDAELTELEVSAVQELMNQMMGFSATAMSEMLGTKIDISPPTMEFCNFGDTMIQKNIEEGKTVEVIFPLEVEGLLKTPMYQIFNPAAAKEMAQLMLGIQAKEVAEKEATTPAEIIEPEKPAEPIKHTVIEEKETLSEMEQILEDIPVTLEVVFGTAKVKLEKFISWCEKDVIILKESMNEPLDLALNGVTIGKGILVRVDDHFGIQMTELVR
ncbi:flagellar motor switch protein [Listeria monocytogenes]|uniref:flagellar motor switch protein n=1 Tax=Listeria monocytogenes TaxID=1639 RepID=UPI0004343483|nr:flagellar motor switch protein [Listeria monocytogenes]EAG6361302.1 flagellar motor switch protein FliN [Listeria monocytogenes CFSAN002351]AKG84847.1 flagellar motor switch protein FliN [Listeria monocytogenes]AQP55576.1 flagellar motor switch protein FliN [Listeria monocytogenes]AQP76039.1 flagellar motor switch protein FliN [Listeria monocytogenes]ASH55081.1 flagellar motor switch protein [Listeria monocytogenes serotype 1/2a str. 10-4754]